MKKVAVGLSGGIDSTATLIRLLDQNYEVIGITLKLIESRNEEGKCCSIQDLYDAKALCAKFNIPHYTLNAKSDFEQKIIQYFINQYLNAKTPNPCTLCNAKVRFEYMKNFSDRLNCDYFATGHYAILEKFGSKVILKKAVDKKKDQSYFLSQISSSLLQKCLFPLGYTTKDENIELLKRRNISIYKKKESYDICFISGKNYTQFIQEKKPDISIKTGNIINEKGKFIGKHKGIIHYTIGQRRGINISNEKPLYVRELNIKKNQITVGEKPLKKIIQINEVNWLLDYNPKELFFIKIRLRHHGEKGYIKKINEGIYEIQFLEPILCATSGQIAVGYTKDNEVAFSGFIL